MLSDKITMDNINSSLQIITLSFICLQLLPHSHMNFSHVPHPCCHLSAFGTICPLALSLSLCRSLPSHPPFGVNSRKDTRVEMLTRYGQRKRMNAGSLLARLRLSARQTHQRSHLCGIKECFIRANILTKLKSTASHP